MYSIGWLTLTMFLIASAGFLPHWVIAQTDSTLADYVRSTAGRRAYGLYLADRKVGWIVEETRLVAQADQMVAVATGEMYFRFASFGENTRYRSKETTTYKLDGSGAILSADQVDVINDRTTTIKVSSNEGGCRITTTAPDGEVSTRTVPVPTERLSDELKLNRWLRSGPSIGERFEIYTTDWTEADVNLKSGYVFKSTKHIVWGGISQEVYEVTMDLQGVQIDALIAADGSLVRGKMAIFDVSAEKEDVAKNLDSGEQVDLVRVSSIAVETELQDSEPVDLVRMEVRGFGDFVLPQSHRQSLVNFGGDWTHVTVRRDFRKARGSGLTDKQTTQFLQATPALQVDHPRIQSLAKQIAGASDGVLERTTALASWVFDNIRASMAANAPTALDVLKDRQGDCTEFTMLFVALARALEIPAREVGGIVFVNQGEPMFGWHAWAEIHDGHQWISVDPAFDQVYVDATHVKFSEGMEDWSWANTVGQLTIRDFQYEVR